MSARSTAVPIGVCLAALALAACGPTESAAGGSNRAPSSSPSGAAAEPYGDKTPEEIQQLAYGATRTATFKKVRGQVAAEGTSGSLDLSFANVDCAGAFNVEGRGRTEIHATPKVVHVKRDADALRAVLNATKAQEDLIVERAADRWIKLGADLSDAKSISYGCGLTNPTILLDPENFEVTRGGTATVDGQPAIMLTYPGTDGGTATDYVAAQGRPYLLKRTETGRQPSDITYYDFETVTQLRPPADSEIVVTDGL